MKIVSFTLEKHCGESNINQKVVAKSKRNRDEKGEKLRTMETHETSVVEGGA